MPMNKEFEFEFESETIKISLHRLPGCTVVVSDARLQLLDDQLLGQVFASCPDFQSRLATQVCDRFEVDPGTLIWINRYDQNNISVNNTYKPTFSGISFDLTDGVLSNPRWHSIKEQDVIKLTNGEWIPDDYRVQQVGGNLSFNGSLVAFSPESPSTLDDDQARTFDSECKRIELYQTKGGAYVLIEHLFKGTQMSLCYDYDAILTLLQSPPSVHSRTFLRQARDHFSNKEIK